MGKLDKLKANSKPINAAELQSKNATALGNILKGEYNQRRFLDLDVIQLNTNNSFAQNDDESSIHDLAEDIKRLGLIHPILVSYRENGNYIILSGERRYKAYKYLRDVVEPENIKWKQIDASIATGLNELDELLILDSANLNVRGVSTNEQSEYVEMCTRFIENLKKRYDLSEKDAIDLATRFTALSRRTLQTNIRLKNDLNENLLEEMYNGNISKEDASIIAKRPEVEQEHILSTYRSTIKAGENGKEAGDLYIKDVSKAIKENRPIKKVKPHESKITIIGVNSKRKAFDDCCAKVEKAVSSFDERKRGNIGAFGDSDRKEFAKRISKCLEELKTLINELES